MIGRRQSSNGRRTKQAGSARKSAPRRSATSAGGIKVTRNSARPQIKASRGPGGPPRRRKVADAPRRRSPQSVDHRVAETRRQSLSSIGGPPPRAAKRAAAPRSSARSQSSGGSVRTIAVVTAGGAVRVAQEVARPVSVVTRPVLRVVSGGLEAIPHAASRTTPATRGRLLILLAGALAAGLIWVNVAKLEAGDGYASYTQRSLQLQRENTQLQSQIANLGSAERIKRYALRQGMVMPAPDQFSYLKTRSGDAQRAARSYKAPTPVTPPAATPVLAEQPAAPVAEPVSVQTPPEIPPQGGTGSGL